MADPASSPRPNRPVRDEPGVFAKAAEGGAEPPTVQSGADGGSSLRRRAMIASMPTPGRRLDTFLIREAIGIGGMGAVFLAQDTALERPVALKILPPEQSGDSEVVQRFYQEARAAARLDHENIARVYTIGGDGSYHYIAFEYIEGTTIRAKVEKSGPLSISEAINYTLQIAGALVHAAERGVVHRDIKPSNIIVTPLDRVKLVDMGLARRFERKADDGLTQSGMTLGTFDYISPEQARDPRDVDVRSDLYSLGCTLFHMLTGRPPFPAGTVLQKLLQHQEEPAPDVRTLNPAVPADLASILLKLMAKDRDRRYQTPEQLVRDLLSVAGALGLRSVSPEGLVWLGTNPPRAWERHLVWGVPTLALGVIVWGLFWWGQPAEAPANVFAMPDRGPEPPSIASKKADPPIKGAPRLGDSPAPKAIPNAPTTPIPKALTLKAGDDLGEAIASAPSGSSITIIESGTFELKASSGPRSESRKDLVLRASKGVSAIVKSAGSGAGPLLRFGTARVAIEGLTFLVDVNEGDSVTSAISAEGTDLSIRACRFLRDPSRTGKGRSAALIVAAPAARSATEERPAPVIVERSFVGPGLIGLIARGASDTIWRDCLIGSTEQAFSIERSGSDRGPARLTLRHTSLIAGDGPVFRVEENRAIVRVDDSVIAAPEGSEATLVSIDDPSRLDWLGRANLYGRIDRFLVPDPADAGGLEIRSFPSWAEGDGVVREVGSTVAARDVWRAKDLDSLLRSPDPAAAFALVPGDRPSADVGARVGPDGPIRSADWLLSAIDRFRAGRPPVGVAEGPLKPDPAVRTGSNSGRIPDPTPIVREGNPPIAEANPPATNPKPPGEASGEAANGGIVPDVATKGVDPERSSPIRTAEQFRDALRAPASRGRKLILGSDASIDLSTCEFRGAGRWSIVAEPGPTRPRIRFTPDPAEIRMPVGFPCLFRVRSGSLEVRGVDILLAKAEAPIGSRWGAFELWAGSDLGLVQTTVTIEGDDPRSAAIAVGSNDDEAEAVVAAEGSAASIRIAESLIRVGGDVVDVEAGRRLEFDASDSDFSSGGSLIHAHGLPKGQASEPVKVTLRQVAARVAGGLANVQSATGEPELPVVGILARETILATTDRGDPLIQVEGQGNVDDLGDRVEWEGHDVAYHLIDLYRRDQSAQTGSVPERYDLQAWSRAVGNKETNATHGDLRFLNPWKPGRAAWLALPADFRLAADSPAIAAGPILKIPSPNSVGPAIDRPEVSTP